MTVAVLVLQALTIERRPSGSGAEQKSLCFVVCSGPNEIANALETKHRIIEIEGDQVDRQVGIGCARSYKRRHGAGFGNPFLEDLAVFGFIVIEQGLSVDRFINLTLG